MPLEYPNFGIITNFPIWAFYDDDVIYEPRAAYFSSLDVVPGVPIDSLQLGLRQCGPDVGDLVEPQVKRLEAGLGVLKVVLLFGFAVIQPNAEKHKS